jgi:D-glycero-D-manno-heptose 1,7-bisphosphate phosphatase
MRLLILDRDGVINQDSDDFIKSPEEWKPIPGSLEAISRASHSDYGVVVASNQSGLARNLFDIDALNAVHARMLQEVASLGGHIEAIFFCPHGPEEGCTCRKPAPGMFVDIGSRLKMPLRGTPVVGDRLSDMEAAKAVGARAILVRTGRGMKTEADGLTAGGRLEDIEIYDDLASVVDNLLGEP